MMNGDAKRDASFASDCRTVVAYLEGAGEAGAAARALRRVVLAADSGPVAEVKAALQKADVSLLTALGHEGGVSLYYDPALAPTANVLHLFEAMLRCPWLAKKVFGNWLEEYPNEYLAAIRETILTSDDYGEFDGLAAMILEHWPWFIENAAFEWLDSEEPKLWRQVAMMWLTVDCGVRSDINMDRRRQLAEAMARHKDPAVRGAGVSELAGILKKMRRE